MSLLTISIPKTVERGERGIADTTGTGAEGGAGEWGGHSCAGVDGKISNEVVHGKVHEIHHAHEGEAVGGGIHDAKHVHLHVHVGGGGDEVL